MDDPACSNALAAFGVTLIAYIHVWNIMASDPKVWHLARLLVDKHGNEALAVVTERALGRLTVQDYRLAILWTRVAEAVRTLCPDVTPERSVWHTHAPLKELMDDPLMNVVVKDDEDRRREVHDTLLDAKRKVRGDGD
jgi:hypothetical protein